MVRMKQINVKNLTLQFDEGYYEGEPHRQARAIINDINEMIRCWDGSPQIGSPARDLGHVDVEVENVGEDEEHNKDN